MKCLYCDKNVGEPHSFAFIGFGANRRSAEESELILRRVPQSVQKVLRDESLRDAFLSDYLASLTLAWHGADWDRNEPHPHIHRWVKFDENHPDLPSPPSLVQGQAEFLFCSCDCLRKWFLRAVDVLESFIHSTSAPESGEILNPCCRAGSGKDTNEWSSTDCL